MIYYKKLKNKHIKIKQLIELLITSDIEAIILGKNGEHN